MKITVRISTPLAPEARRGERSGVRGLSEIRSMKTSNP